ncbi:MAG TPA: PadR family transcriptional regulator [Actinotalea sp.]
MIDVLILGVLRNGPVHGYELKRRVERPALRPLSNNSLYPLLRRFEQAGAVTKRVEPTEGRPPRNIYELTDEGQALFHRLITTLTPEQAAQDESFLLRVGYFADMSAPERTTLLDARDAALASQEAQARELLASVNDQQGWRTVTMAHLLQRLAHDRAFVSELRRAVAAGGPQ